MIGCRATRVVAVVSVCIKQPLPGPQRWCPAPVGLNRPPPCQSKNRNIVPDSRGRTNVADKDQ